MRLTIGFLAVSCLTGCWWEDGDEPATTSEATQSEEYVPLTGEELERRHKEILRNLDETIDNADQTTKMLCEAEVTLQRSIAEQMHFGNLPKDKQQQFDRQIAACDPKGPAMN